MLTDLIKLKHLKIMILVKIIFIIKNENITKIFDGTDVLYIQDLLKIK